MGKIFESLITIYFIILVSYYPLSKIIPAIFEGFGIMIGKILFPRKKIEALSSKLQERYESLEEKLNREYNEKSEFVNKILKETKQSFPSLAKAFSDTEWYISEERAKYLENKKSPAYTAADNVREFGKKNRELTKKCKELEYQLIFFETLFPWLEEFKEVPIAEAVSSVESDDKNTSDPVKDWLSPVEYKNLSTREKNQIALDRYKKRKNKTSWEIGIEYERYIGYLYEQDQYTVEYRGAIDGLQDMGRDLIATKNNKKLVIQCKYWNNHKTIHEKHIFQLFGTTVMLKLQNKTQDIKGIFITSATLSDTAKQVAGALGIKYRENVPLNDYPCIKCNINNSTHEHIYHLPFDLQYDKCIIDNQKGEFYALTVAEAEDKGFRRAYKWLGAD